MHLRNIKIQYLKTKHNLKEFKHFFFRSGFSAYILSVRLILESILARQTTTCGIYCKISFAHVCIINARRN